MIFSDRNQYWMGATVHNSVQEYKEFAGLESVGLAPTGLYVLITNWSGDGATFMLHKRWYSVLPTETLQAYFANYPASIAGGLVAVFNVVARQIDVSIGFRLEPGTSFDVKTSDDVKEVTYHELTHTSQFRALGVLWYTNLANAEASAIIASPFGTAQSPYGDGTATYSPIIALGESWAYHMGHVMAERRYGTLGSCQQPQSFAYSYGSSGCNIVGSGHAHLDALEFFNPNLNGDPFKWIPKGIYQDLRDGSGETFPITDNVNGFYTNLKMFTAFSSSITTMQGFRANLLGQNSNNQLTQVTDLFTQYHY